MSKKEEIKKIILAAGHTIVSEKPINNCGYQFTIENGAIVNVFNTGKISYQGKNSSEIKAIIEPCVNAPVETVENKQVFVVYGHDKVARTQLEAMLRRWNLDPIILDQIASNSDTVIEKLEKNTKKVQYGIVLATPDDIGYAKNQPENKKERVRQNVVLELGMLLSALGRERVAILLKQDENFERPSDIEGLIYIPFTSDVEETKVSLAKEMKEHKYNIDISNL